MTNHAPDICLATDEFARLYSMRVSRLMWFLGAGASAHAGVPTAIDMLWEFKQRLYISQRRIAPGLVQDLSNPTVRSRLQEYIDSIGRLPSQGEPDEYAALFEKVYPNEKDRRAYLDGKLLGASPSYGHLALATLMRDCGIPIIWTTNFDTLIADACAKVFGTTGSLTVVTPDAPDIAPQLIQEGRWPLEVKLHGDFRSTRLKNTNDELREQDTRLRHAFADCSRQFGLIVIGYSGRDSSVMQTLYEAIDHDNAFPGGLFWLLRDAESPPNNIYELISCARQNHIDAAIVGIENFDEALRDLIRLTDGCDTQFLDEFAQGQRHRTPAPSPGGRSTWPVVRLNAVPIIRYPNVCRRVMCNIGGVAEVREAVNNAQANVLVGRKRSGVLAFGADAEIRRVLRPYGITEFDLHTIEARRLRYDSAERGLLRESLATALSYNRSLAIIRKRSQDLVFPLDHKADQWNGLRDIVGSITGSVDACPELTWHEGAAIRLEWANEQIWLVIDPRIVFIGIDQSNQEIAADFARERTVKRYNKSLNALIGYWANLLAGTEDSIYALNVTDGVDAEFRLSDQTAFSRRAVV